MAQKKVKFTKMDGLGNDFVILDGRSAPIKLSLEEVKEISRRNNLETAGCDQLVIMEPSEKADVFMRIYNADGGEVDACGNASRCVAQLVGKEQNKKEISIETGAGILSAVIVGRNVVSVDMGKPGLNWRDIPIAKELDTLHLGIEEGALKDPVGVSMGNPHAVFFMYDIEGVNLQKLGPKLEHHPLFPQRANIGIARVVKKDEIRLRVWERGAGETKACGTGACAALVAANRRGLSGRKATVHLLGGALEINWDERTDHVIMTGAVSGAEEKIMTI